MLRVERARMSSRQKSVYKTAVRLLMRGYFRRQVVLPDYRPNFANQPGQPFHFGEGRDEGRHRVSARRH